MGLAWLALEGLRLFGLFLVGVITLFVIAVMGIILLYWLAEKYVDRRN